MCPTEYTSPARRECKFYYKKGLTKRKKIIYVHVDDRCMCKVI